MDCYERYLLLLLLIFPSINSHEQGGQCAEDIVDTTRKRIENLIESKRINIPPNKYPQVEVPDGVEEYDMIVVGSGSAGSILTNRLSEVAEWKVLLLEAGSVPDVLVDVPMLLGLQQFTQHNWGFLTEKEDNFALGLENQRMHWPRGKGLGGTSLINYMVYTRGNRIDYDRWAAMGNEGWSYDELLPYFKKLEDCTISVENESYRGKTGNLTVEYPSHRTKAAEIFLEAAKETGYDYLDYNGPEQMGASYIQASIRNGLRCSGEKAFVRPAKNRRNLTIRLNSHVTKVLVHDETRTAYGVEYVHKNKSYVAKATKEVVLSAGVLNSAHILMLSGIGPREQLEKFDVKVIQALPVGRKIYDHSVYWGLAFTANESITYDFDKVEDPELYVELFNKGKGPLNNLGGLETIAFVKTDASDDPAPMLPDIEFLLMTAFHNVAAGTILRKMIRMTDRVYNAVFKPLEGKPTFGIIPMIMQPKSYGFMELQSADPFIYPKIYGGYLTDPEGHDLKTMIAGIREAIRIAKAPAFRRYGVKVVDTKIPGCEAHEYDTDSYWECALRHLMSTIYHHTTTCKMGPAADPEAVVDERLRVRGIRHLRVADTSIIPLQLTAHTNVPAYMVGEKAGALIKEDWL